MAHQKAVAEALKFIESNLLYSREGTRGVRQVDVTGLVAAAFTHRDSRAGDPDLHTHVAVANKVRTVGSGKWLSIDARVLYRGVVAASETYNTALTKLLEREGLRFTDRASRSGRRPVREIAGVAAELNERWSSRRADIEVRRADLVAAFQADHGRPPSVVESVKLAQQATLETRDAKHEPRSLAEQRSRLAPAGRRDFGFRRRADQDAGPHPRRDRETRPAACRRGLVRGCGRSDRRGDGSPGGDLAGPPPAGRSAANGAPHRHTVRPRRRRREPVGGHRRRPVDPAGAWRPGHHRTRTAAPRRRHLGVHGRRGRPVHLRPGGGGRTPVGRVGRPDRRPHHRTDPRGRRAGGQRRKRAES